MKQSNECFHEFILVPVILHLFVSKDNSLCVTYLSYHRALNPDKQRACNFTAKDILNIIVFQEIMDSCRIEGVCGKKPHVTSDQLVDSPSRLPYTCLLNKKRI